MSLIIIDTSSYNGFRADALARASQGLGYDVDGYWGYQCWDLAAELWQNIGYGAGYPITGPNHYARECWTNSRDINKGSDFDLIYNIEDLKRGDVIVIDASSISSTGHIAICDEDYNGTTHMNLLGQNQVNPSASVGHIPTVTNLNISAFLGAFRYHGWRHYVTPKSKFQDTGFNWALYARKLRNKY